MGKRNNYFPDIPSGIPLTWFSQLTSLKNSSLFRTSIINKIYIYSIVRSLRVLFWYSGSSRLGSSTHTIISLLYQHMPGKTLWCASSSPKMFLNVVTYGITTAAPFFWLFWPIILCTVKDMSYPLSCWEKDNYSFRLIETAVEETNQIWGENWNWGNGRFESVDSINT